METKSVELPDIHTLPHISKPENPLVILPKERGQTRARSIKTLPAPTNMPKLMPRIIARQEGILDISSRVLQAPPTVCEVEPPRKPRGRKRSLSPTTRESAAGVRMVGACVRCRQMKEKCDKQQPCRTCTSTRLRSFDFPCMKEWPEHRGAYLLTDATTGHLQEPLFLRTLREMEWSCPENQPFHIRLRQDFPYHLRIPVREFNPAGGVSTDKTIFPIAKTGATYKVQLGKLLSPPLVPAMSIAEYIDDFRPNFRKEIGNWLRRIEVDDQADWHETFFHVNYGRAWPRAVLAIVCQFFHKVINQACNAIRFALKSTVLVHMIRHVFYIEPDDVATVLQRMRFGRQLRKTPDNFVCPEYVDRFIKVLLCPILQGCINETMKRYQALYPGRRVALLTRDRFLATSLVLLMIAAAQQQTVVERGHLYIERGVESDMSKAHQTVVEIEDQFVKPVLELWNHKFSIGRDFVAESDREERLMALRAKSFNLLGKFRASYAEHGKSCRQSVFAADTDFPTEGDLKGLNPELSFELDVRQFSATNTTRLLKKFYLHVFNRPDGQQTSGTSSSVPEATFGNLE